MIGAMVRHSQIRTLWLTLAGLLMALLSGCGSMSVDKAFVIAATDEVPGYHYRVSLTAKEVGYFNAHLMQFRREEAQHRVDLYFKTREGVFTGDEIGGNTAPLRGKVTLTQSNITISLEYAQTNSSDGPIVGWIPCEFNGRFKLVDQ